MTAYEALNTNLLATLTLLESDNPSMDPSIVCSGLETTSHDWNTPPAPASVDERNEAPVASLADEAEKQGGLQGSAHSEANTAPVFSLEDNAASDTEASRGRHNANKNRIITSVAQLEGLLWEGRDKCGAHVRSLEDLKQYKEALKAFLLAPQMNGQLM